MFSSWPLLLNSTPKIYSSKVLAGKVVLIANSFTWNVPWFEKVFRGEHIVKLAYKMPGFIVILYTISIGILWGCSGPCKPNQIICKFAIVRKFVILLENFAVFWWNFVILCENFRPNCRYSRCNWTLEWFKQCSRRSATMGNPSESLSCNKNPDMLLESHVSAL